MALHLLFKPHSQLTRKERKERAALKRKFRHLGENLPAYAVGRSVLDAESRHDHVQIGPAFDLKRGGKFTVQLGPVDHAICCGAIAPDQAEMWGKVIDLGSANSEP
jgi:hypothetical protein